jgi:hypothetical protein
MTEEEHCMRTGKTGDLSPTDRFKLEALNEGDGAAGSGRPLDQEDIAILPEWLT